MQYIKIDDNGDKFYYKDKEMTILHREDGPAIEFASGSKVWYLNGKAHCEDGPAAEWANGDKEWHLNGNELTEEEFNKAIKGNKIMLVLTRKEMESIIIDKTIKISIIQIEGRKVKIGIDAPAGMSILREEIVEKYADKGAEK